MSEQEQDVFRNPTEESASQGVPPDVANTSGREQLSESGALKESAQQVGQQVGQTMEKVTQKSNDFIMESSDQVAETLDRVSQCLRDTSRDMTEHEHPLFGRYVRSAADSMSRFSDTVRHKDMDFLFRRTEDLARHQPGVFLGSAFTIGFALGRFLKNQSSRHGEVIPRREYSAPGVSAISADVEPEVWH